MAFRFFRRLKIAPGLTLNLSKGGASLSGGVRGARVTVGRQGVRRTLGLPGSGAHWTKQTSWKQLSDKGGRAYAEKESVGTDQLTDAMEDPEITLVNPRTNRKYSARQLQRELERRKLAEDRALAEAEVESARTEYREILDHWTRLPNIPTLEEFESYREPVAFEEMPPPDAPDFEEARQRFLDQLTTDRRKGFPYNLLPEFVARAKVSGRLEERWPEQANRIQKAYRERVEQHQHRMKRQRAHHRSEEKERLEDLARILSDDPEATTALAADVFANIDWPFATEAQVGTDDGKHLFVHLDLPEQEDVIQTTEPQLGRNGEIVEKRRPKTEQNEDYFRLVVGQAVYLAAQEFAWNPTLDRVTLAAYTQRTRRKPDDPKDCHLYEITLTQENIRGFDPETRSLASLLAECGARIDIGRYHRLKPVDPPSWI